MGIQIFYFSGTGNSLHVARELQKRISEIELKPMVETLIKDKIETNEQTIGFVFPLHCWTIPYLVKQFLQKVDLQSATYLFAIVTRGGSPSGVFKDVNKILNKKGKSLDACFYIDMPNNCQLHHFKTVTQEIVTEKERELQKTLDFIKQTVVNKQVSQIMDYKYPSFKKRMMRSILKTYALTYGRYSWNKAFYFDPKCIGCGLCKKICLAKKIEMKRGKPLWKKEIKCSLCFACINYCPVQAVQIKGYQTAMIGRYHHPQISPEEIFKQKGD